MMSLARQYVRPEITALSAYPVADAAGLIKLDAMENPFPLPPALQAELAQRLASAALNRYPDPDGGGLKARLKAAFAIPDNAAVLLGNGSDELITLICQTLAHPGASLLSAEPSFVMYKMNAVFSSVQYVGVPLKPDFSLDLPAMLAAIAQHQPAVVFVSYPNNPTGPRYARAEVEALLDAAPGLVVVDEAYTAFAEDSFMPLAGRHPKLVVMRTLSKLGLAGIRLGYMAGPADWINEFDKLRPPYNINVLTQTTALFALDHIAVFNEQAALLRAERSRLLAALVAMPAVTAYPSEANFFT
ncbi:histidinol-phosphate transaminase, partial [Chitinimonas sp.]|uniref:pyridoxal phosphate-dependent aminotransferase n=1 Tax=Chitinimonas sp. TaxID=1934313 RepID=UPI0035AD7A87